MTIEKVKCDGCGKETDDLYTEVGWIHIHSGAAGSIIKSITNGRNEDGCAETKHYKSFSEAHFCHLDCLVDFLYDRRAK